MLDSFNKQVIPPSGCTDHTWFMPLLTHYSLEGKGRQAKQMPPPIDTADLERNKFSIESRTLLNTYLAASPISIKQSQKSCLFFLYNITAYRSLSIRF